MYIRKKMTEEDYNRLRANLEKQPLKLSQEPVCDFCGDPKPVYIFAATKTSSNVNVSCWRWSACEDCVAAIDRHDFDKIEDKIAKWLMKAFELPDGYPPAMTTCLLTAHLVIDEFHKTAIRMRKSGSLN